jgi:DNA-binding FadR family transcriptional regulator
VGPRRTEKLSEVLAREIVRDLRNLPPTTMLPPEATMLETYQVGRASLREALRLLEVQGLIVIRPGPGGGPMVAQVDSLHYSRISSLYYHMSDATYQDVVEARSVIEPVLARLVAERADPDDLRALEDFIEGHTRDRPEDQDYETYVEDASGFHAMLVGMAGNPVLSLTAHSLQDVLLDRVHGLYPLEERARVHKVHVAIAQGILDGDGDEAERLMREHMDEYVDVTRSRHPGVIEGIVDWH